MDLENYFFVSGYKGYIFWFGDSLVKCLWVEDDFVFFYFRLLFLVYSLGFIEGYFKFFVIEDRGFVLGGNLYGGVGGSSGDGGCFFNRLYL